MTLSIPGPRGRLLPTLRLLRDPTTYYAQMRARHGDPFLVRALNGDVVLTGDPEGVKQIFTAKPETFAPFGVEAARALVGDHSVFLLDQGTHKRMRKLLMPPFHGARMRAYTEIIDDVAIRHARALEPGEEIEAAELGMTISFEVILRAVFGLEEDRDIATHTQAIGSLLDAARPELLFFRALQRAPLGLGPWRVFQDRKEIVDALFQEQIERCRSRETPGQDILTLLLEATDEEGEGLSDAEVRDELMTLLFAGHETTGIALSWALHHLHHHPEALKRLREELSRGEREYLKAVVKETLRLHPIVPDNIRVLRKDFDLLGHTIPAGYCVGAAACMVHHDPEVYPDPMSWKPERFLETKPTPFTFFPFGGGHRRCIGAAFATFEAEIVLARLIQERHFAPLEPKALEPVRRNITMGPARGARMRVEM